MMQTNLLILCDRCGLTVNGLVSSFDYQGKLVNYTGGFYDVTEGSWGYFAQDGEESICDNCMHSDPEYQRIYGKTNVIK